MLRLSKVPWTSFFLLLIFAPTAVAQPAPEVIATTPSAAPTTEAAEPAPEPPLIRKPPEPTQEERLGEWLDVLARRQGSSQYFSGFQATLWGTLFATLGGVWFARSTSGEHPSQLKKGFGLLAMVVGGTMVGRGIYHLAVPPTIEKASEQYQSALGRGLSEKELARFEGILATCSDEFFRRQTRLDRWRGLGWLAGGGLILALTPVADLSADNDDRGFAYTIGAVTASLGALSFGFSFKKVPSAWERYLDGEVPEPRKRTARVTPSVGRTYAGLSVSGAF